MFVLHDCGGVRLLLVVLWSFYSRLQDQLQVAGYSACLRLRLRLRLPVLCLRLPTDLYIS